MEKLSANRKLRVISGYFLGKSYQEIADQQGLSKGTIANIIAELKAGVFPETSGVRDQVDSLRELSLHLRQAGLTPGQCATGLAILQRTQELGLGLADLGRWPQILKQCQTEVEAQAFIQLIYSIGEVQQRTNLSLEELQSRAQDLEAKVKQMEPLAAEVAGCQQQKATLEREIGGLTVTLTHLQEKQDWLHPRVEELGQQAKALSWRLQQISPQAEQAEAALLTLRKEKRQLQGRGLTLERMADFSQKVITAAHRQHSTRERLWDYLLELLEKANQGTDLEARLKSQQQTLSSQQEQLASINQEIHRQQARLSILKQQTVSQEEQLQGVEKQISREIQQVTPLIQATLQQSQTVLQKTLGEAQGEIRTLKEAAVAAGSEMGRYQGLLEANQQLAEIEKLILGEDRLTAHQVRVMGHAILKGLELWLQQHTEEPGVTDLLSEAGNLVRRLEKWAV